MTSKEVDMTQTQEDPALTFNNAIGSFQEDVERILGKDHPLKGILDMVKRMDKLITDQKEFINIQNQLIKNQNKRISDLQNSLEQGWVQ